MTEPKKRSSSGAASTAHHLRSSQRIGPKSRIFMLCIFVIVAGATLLTVLRLASDVRHEQLTAALDTVAADYTCSDPYPGGSTHESPWHMARELMRGAGLTSFRIVSVTICRGDPDDRQLSFLHQLRELESLELRSDLATDETLRRIGGLRKLRSLTIAGDKFSIQGLLRLRSIVSLERLRLDLASYTPIELAVLKSELSSVEMRDITQANHSPRPIVVAY